ncbi:uncharacterized protein LOC129901356 [Solanum dulcamara]|uniref:uncharacterized protein LOC129901356 n=1 Tax=Solanum dulcamara TaxID=45834 RepID=UPI0024852621|nr:uncharacterized protein LOC129901356 [Solanum dulcamara]
MAEALFELEEILISRKEALTSEEAKLLNSWKQNAIRDFGIGATGASFATWLVTRRLNNLVRMNLTAGVGFYYGIRRFAKCVDSEIEQILSQHGTRLQTEMAEIMLKKHQHDPHVLQRVSKHFFCENVYDDDSTDRPKSRWRIRNLFEEDLASAHMTYDDDSYNKKINSVKTDPRKTNLQRKQINTGAAADGLEAIEDPFDCIFGSSASVQDIHHPDTLSTPFRRRNYNQKRSHRRHRMRHKENMDV